MPPWLQISIGLWIGCLVAEMFDGFRATKGLIREMTRQWTWIRTHALNQNEGPGR